MGPIAGNNDGVIHWASWSRVGSVGVGFSGIHRRILWKIAESCFDSGLPCKNVSNELIATSLFP